MFVFRAIFWFGMAMMLMPHEPDLGIRHQADVFVPVRAFLWERVAQVESDIARAQSEAAARPNR